MSNWEIFGMGLAGLLALLLLIKVIRGALGHSRRDSEDIVAVARPHRGAAPAPQSTATPPTTATTAPNPNDPAGLNPTPAHSTSAPAHPPMWKKIFTARAGRWTIGMVVLALALWSLWIFALEPSGLMASWTPRDFGKVILVAVGVVAFVVLVRLMPKRTPPPPPPAEVVVARLRGRTSLAMVVFFGAIALAGLWMLTHGGTRALIQINTTAQAAAPAKAPAQATSSAIRLTAADCNGQGKTYYLTAGQEIINGGLCPSGFDNTGGGPVKEYLANGSVRTVDVGVRLGYSGNAPMTKIVATAPNTRVFLTLYPQGQSPNTQARAQAPACPRGGSCPRWP